MSFGTPDRDDPEIKKIRVTEAVPEQLADMGFLDSWRQMARRSAFDEMMNQIGAEDTFTAKFQLRELWEPSPGGNGRRLSIVCEVEYLVEGPKKI